jgi:translation initiation factor 4G
MTSTAPSSQNPGQTANAASATPSGTTTPTSAAPAQSYASATKKTGASGNPPSAAAGGNTPSAQHGKTNSVSPVNGNNPITPAVPSVGGAPTIVNSANGAPTQPGHSRRQSSVTISASGTSGYVPNGGPVAPNSRPNINFGSMNAGSSPAMSNSVPNHSQNSSLNAPSNSNPRVTSPAHSPSPIPPPAHSGGRPPSLSGPGNGLNFVAMGENGDHNVSNLPPLARGSRALTSSSPFLHRNHRADPSPVTTYVDATGSAYPEPVAPAPPTGVHPVDS